MSETTMIPLTKLVEDKANVRVIGKRDGIGELAASIKAQGLLQSMVVKEADKGKYAVCAGGRRLRALRLLAKNGDIEKSMPIPCRIVPADQAAEASLAENVVRSNMHPADEIEAFARLCEAGEGPEAIGARFGVNGVHVARRLKLARVSPKLMEAFRRDELDLDQLSALAFTDDHSAQEAAFFQAPDWARTPERLKAQLAQAHVAETDKLARFVGVDAYVDAGGTLATDLFAEDEETRFLSDRDLLVRLGEAKLVGVADEARAEGWAWVEIAVDGPAWSQFPERVREQRRPLDEAQQAEQERLYEALDATEDEAEIERLEAAIDALSPSSWNAEEVKLAGAIISLSHSGEIKIYRGLVKAEDAKALRALRKQTPKQNAADKEPAEDDNGVAPITGPASPGIPAKLADELMAHKTLALRVEVASRPDLALRLLVLGLASNALNHDYNVFSLVSVRVDEADAVKRIACAESSAPAALARVREQWADRLPANTDALWAFISDLDQATLLELLAVLVAPAIELRPARTVGVSDAICSAAELDMTKYWTATVDSYFNHIRKDALVEAMMDAKPSLDRSALQKMSKKELLGRAKRIFKGSKWLPELLRNEVMSSEPAAIAAE